MISFSDYYNTQICETAEAGLANKAKKSGVSIDTLRKVYRRGVAAWNSGHRPGTTPQQWGMARVNSYITKGKGTYGGADKDLHEEELISSFNLLPEVVKSIDSGEYDYEGQMARIQLQTILRNSKDLIDMLSDEDNMPEWVQSKITLAQDYITCVRDYLQSNQELGEELDLAQEGDTSKLPRVTKDKASGLPKTYVKGLSAATAKARAAHWKKMGKLSDSDPRAYEPAPGDTTAKTKESRFTKKYHAMFGEEMHEEMHEACWTGYKQVGMKKKQDRMVPNCVPEELTPNEQFDIIEEVVIELAQLHNLDPELVWEKFEDIEDSQLYEYAIDAKGYKSSTGGLTQKGVDAYNRKTGGHLKTAVTTKPSKLKPGSKAANRRKSFCARMGGMPGAMKDDKGRPTRKALALRKWNC